ncbi:MAG TPA: 16S rRNA (guanine(527)-N(7))-methyltransferase RsmG [Feifaniaceae bacterium]|nr:16S rRNA (guanine(527)-N(7))-methyltransferase RsmG [Feifaniaceae bacterium]
MEKSAGIKRMLTILKEKLPDLSDMQRERLARYYELIVKGNETMNLTAIVSPEEAADKHFADSLLALPYLPQNARCIDVGTGAGFPGIPLLIARPDLQMTLLDSLNKRVRFLEDTLQTLELRAQCVHARAEDAARTAAHREAYDIALSRAVAPLPALLELTAPFLNVGGVSVCYKGRNAEEELEAAKNAANILHFTLSAVSFSMPYGERALIFAKKTAPTPGAYPRKAGEAARKPL